MSKGLVKAKKYDWKDSNMAMFGSDTEKEVKKESAEAEPAWEGAGAAPGLKIWRIVEFEVKDWPVEDYGEFYNGDSYIILKTYQEEESEKLLHDVHFWIGKNSTQDEYATAAYKTVELDTLLDGLPVQHREVQGHESPLFKSYFKTLTLKEGGADSGFRHVPPEEYVPRLFKFAKDKRGKIVSQQISKCKALVTENDVFIMDAGVNLYQYNGENCSPFEKSAAMQYIGEIKSCRGEAEEEIIDASTRENHPFWEALTEEEEDPSSDDEDSSDKVLLRVNVETKENEVVKEGEYTTDDLNPDDVFIVDCGEEVFVWVGENADPKEKKNGFPYAHNYLREHGQPWKSISVVKQGQKCPAFDLAMAA